MEHRNVRQDTGDRNVPDLRAFLSATPIHGSTADAVTDALREAILSGTLTPDTWLREEDLAKQLSVSRTPVREALSRLADERLTVRTSHRGTLVAPMNLDDLIALHVVRENLEGLAARMMAIRRPLQLIERMRETHEQMVVASAEARFSEIPPLNIEFHRLLREGSGNAYLDRFLGQVEHAVRRFGRNTYEVGGRLEHVLEEHRAIVDAIASGDADRSEAASKDHNQKARQVRIQLISGIPADEGTFVE